MRLQFEKCIKPGMKMPDYRARFGPLTYIVKLRPAHGWYARYPTTTSLTSQGPYRKFVEEAQWDCESHLQSIADALDAKDRQ